MENRMEQNKENMNTNNEHYGEKAEKQRKTWKPQKKGTQQTNKDK